MSSPPGSPRICVTATSGLPDRGLGFCPKEDSAAKRDPATARSPDFFSRFLEHDPEKACPALDAGWVPVFPRDKREAFARRSCSNKKIERDDDSKKSHPALGLLGTDRERAACRARSRLAGLIRSTEVQATSGDSRCRELRPDTRSSRCCPARSVSAVWNNRSPFENRARRPCQQDNAVAPELRSEMGSTARRPHGSGRSRRSRPSAGWSR